MGDVSEAKEVFTELKRQILERVDLSRDVSDEEMQELIDEVVISYGKEQAVSLNERCRLKKELFHALRKMDVLQELLEEPDVTQNIDGLHQAAGSKMVYELHGSVHRNYCQICGAFYDARYMLESKGIPKCEKCGGIIKPDVVLYEEGLDDATMRGAIRAISHADVLIIGGTSLTVYPAAGLIDYYNGNKLVLINKSVTPMDSRADLLVQGPIGEIFSQL